MVHDPIPRAGKGASALRARGCRLREVLGNRDAARIERTEDVAKRTSSPPPVAFLFVPFVALEDHKGGGLLRGLP